MIVGAPLMAVNAHLDEDTALEQRLYRADEGTGRQPWVVLVLGDESSVALFAHDVAVLTALGELVERARRDLARELGVLPSGEPCAYADVFGSWDWNEHDHDRCLVSMVDEPVPYVPADPVPAAGTAWERHDDPTVSDDGGGLAVVPGGR